MTKIVLALDNFHRWLLSEFYNQRMASTIERLLDRGLIDGFEVVYSAEDLASPWHLLPERFTCLPVQLQARVIDSLSSIHLPSLGHLNTNEKLYLAHSVKHAYEAGLCSEFTIHPDNTAFQDWKMFLQHIPQGAVISVENMDKNKQNYRTLDELIHLTDSFPQLQITLDICHWLELGHESDSPDLLEFIGDRHERITKVHFSAPSSNASWYNRAQGMQDNHNLVANSGWNISPAFYRALTHVPFVIEGGIPLGCIEGIVSEVELIRKNITQNSIIREQEQRAA